MDPAGDAAAFEAEIAEMYAMLDQIMAVVDVPSTEAGIAALDYQEYPQRWVLGDDR
jgi:transaldolase